MAKPKLRFKKDDGTEFPDWEIVTIGDIVDRQSIPINVKPNEFYQEIGIRSHGKGLFYKTPVQGIDLGNKRVFKIIPECLVINIVFAWERAVAKTTINEVGMIASHRFPMYKPKENILDLDYIARYLITDKGKQLLELASPGGAGRNRTLGQKDFANSKLMLPCYAEQKKIAELFDELDKIITASENEINTLETLNQAVMEKIFSQEVRFKTNDGSEYPEWNKTNLGELCTIKTGKLDANAMVETGEYPFFTCSHETYKIDRYTFDGEAIIIAGNGDLGHTKHYIGKFDAYQRTYVLMHFKELPLFLKTAIDYYLPTRINKETCGSAMPYIKLSTLTTLELPIPCKEEQQKIADFLSNFDELIETARKELELWKELKKGLLQQMFV